MKCRHFLRLLNRYVDGEFINEIDKEQMERHIKQCSACRSEYDHFVALKKVVSQKKKVSVSEGFRREVMKKISSLEEDAEVRVEQLDYFARRLIPVPLMIALALAFFIVRFYTQKITLDDYYLSMFSDKEIGILNGTFSAVDILGIKGGV